MGCNVLLNILPTKIIIIIVKSINFFWRFNSSHALSCETRVWSELTWTSEGCSPYHSTLIFYSRLSKKPTEWNDLFFNWIIIGYLVLVVKVSITISEFVHTILLHVMLINFIYHCLHGSLVIKNQDNGTRWILRLRLNFSNRFGVIFVGNLSYNVKLTYSTLFAYNTTNPKDQNW